MRYIGIGLLAICSVAYSAWHCPHGNWIWTLCVDFTLAQAWLAASVFIVGAAIYDVAWVRRCLIDYAQRYVETTFLQMTARMAADAGDAAAAAADADADADAAGDETDTEMESDDKEDPITVMRRILRQCTYCFRKTDPTEPPCPLCKDILKERQVRLGLHPTSPRWVRVDIEVSGNDTSVRLHLTTPPCLHVTIAPSMPPFSCKRCAGRMHAECACALAVSGHTKCLHCTMSF